MRISFFLHPELRRLAEECAGIDELTLSAYIRFLIIQDAARRGLVRYVDYEQDLSRQAEVCEEAGERTVFAGEEKREDGACASGGG